MTDHKDLIERLAWPVNPNAPEAKVNLPAWVLDLCAEARDALKAAQVERDAVWAEATAAAYGAAAYIAHEGALATEDDGVAAWVRDRIKAQTPQSARDWLAERDQEIVGRCADIVGCMASDAKAKMEEARTLNGPSRIWVAIGSYLPRVDLRALQIKEKDYE